MLERAIGHVVKVIEHADDSDGTIGDLARELLEMHATACDSGMAEPVRLAGWMVRFWFVDQDLFEVDAVRYQHALGEIGLTAYRQAVAAGEHEDTFALQYVRERLAVLDGDTDRIVALLGGDLTRPHQFAQVAEAMAELGRDKDCACLVQAWDSANPGLADPPAVRPGVRDARRVWAAARGASPAPLPA